MEITAALLEEFVVNDICKETTLDEAQFDKSMSSLQVPNPYKYTCL